MNKKIYLLIILALAVQVSFGQKLSQQGRESVTVIVTKFGQLLDMSTATGAKQTGVRDVDGTVAEEFRNLFRQQDLDQDTLREAKDSLVIVSFLDPNIRLFDCYTKIKDTNQAVLKQKVDSCLNSKKTLENFPKLSVNQFIDTVFKYYTKTISDINENAVAVNENARHVGRKRYQVIAEATLGTFSGNINVNYSGPLGFGEYRYKYELPKEGQPRALPLNLRFYVSYEVYNMKGGKGETNFKIDSVTLIKPVEGEILLGLTKSRGYLEPYISYGLSFPKLTTDDPRFDDLTKDNSTMMAGGIKATFFFNNRSFSKWDLGFTTGVAYKSLRSNYSLGEYTDSLQIDDDYTAEQLGGEYDLYAHATNLDQHNRINALEVPLQLSVNYYFSQKRTIGLYGRLGGVFNLVLSNLHEMNDGSATYSGHVGRVIDGEYTDFYFGPNIPDYGFSTYDATVSDDNELALNNYFISGRLNIGVLGMNKPKTVGWFIGTFYEMDLTDMLGSDHEASASLTRGYGNMNSFYEITDKLGINNWGLEFGIIIQIFKEHKINLE